tara:strand:- start:561 stop:1394 length:834 start_codon:yes stop_codon:yes gene_type:complete
MFDGIFQNVILLGILALIGVLFLYFKNQITQIQNEVFTLRQVIAQGLTNIASSANGGGVFGKAGDNDLFKNENKEDDDNDDEDDEESEYDDETDYDSENDDGDDDVIEIKPDDDNDNLIKVEEFDIKDMSFLSGDKTSIINSILGKESMASVMMMGVGELNANVDIRQPLDISEDVVSEASTEDTSLTYKKMQLGQLKEMVIERNIKFTGRPKKSEFIQMLEDDDLLHSVKNHVPTNITVDNEITETENIDINKEEKEEVNISGIDLDVDVEDIKID